MNSLTPAVDDFFWLNGCLRFFGSSFCHSECWTEGILKRKKYLSDWHSSGLKLKLEGLIGALGNRVTLLRLSLSLVNGRRSIESWHPGISIHL